MVSGTGFETGARLLLDDVVIPATAVSATRITAVAPPHPPGPIDIVVINPNGRASRLEQGFSYVAPQRGPPHYRVSGVVTDERGSPVSNVHIELRYFVDDAGHRAFTRTGTNGRYAIEFDATRYRDAVAGVPDLIAVAYAWPSVGMNYADDAQLVATQETEVVRNLRVRRLRTIESGQSLAIDLDPDSPLCNDTDSYFSLTTRCETVQIAAVATGTLTVEARSDGADDAAPIVQTYGPPWARAPRAISLAVKSGEVVRILVEIPVAPAPKRYVLLSSVQSEAR